LRARHTAVVVLVVILLVAAVLPVVGRAVRLLRAGPPSFE
jgi:hypothetical protein